MRQTTTYHDVMAVKKVETEPVAVRMSKADKAILDRILDERDMKQAATMGRILTWFIRQEPNVQALVLGHIKEKETSDFVEFIHSQRQTAEERLDELEVMARQIADQLQLKSRPGRKRKASGK